MAIYSDFHINSQSKIEILPTDKITDEENLFTPGDRYISVYRPVENDLVANLLHRFFLADFIARVKSDESSIVSALSASIEASNTSFLTPATSVDSIPDSGAMALLVYMSVDNTVLVAQLGTIQLKKNLDGHFTAISNDSNRCFFGYLDQRSCLEETRMNPKQFVSSFNSQTF